MFYRWTLLELDEKSGKIMEVTRENNPCIKYFNRISPRCRKEHLKICFPLNWLVLLLFTWNLINKNSRCWVTSVSLCQRQEVHHNWEIKLQSQGEGHCPKHHPAPCECWITDMGVSLQMNSIILFLQGFFKDELIIKVNDRSH